MVTISACHSEGPGSIPAIAWNILDDRKNKTKQDDWRKWNKNQMIEENEKITMDNEKN